MREFLLFVEESAYKVPVTGGGLIIWPTASATAFYGRLDGGDSFTMRARPAMVTVPYGGGVNVPAFTVSDKFICKGRYSTKLYAGPFSQFLFQWASQQVNSHGVVAASGTTGWATTEAPGNLASVTILHAIQRPQDGTYKCQQYSGVKVDSWNLTMSEDSQIATLNMELTGGTAMGNPFDGSLDPTIGSSAWAAPVWGSGSTPTVWYPPTYTHLPINPYLFVNCTNTAAIGSGASGTAVLGTGATATEVVSITVGGAGGSGYTIPPVVSFTGGGGYGAQANAIVSAGVITSFVMQNTGIGYTSAPTVVITPQSSGGLTIGSSRTTFQEVNMTSTNSLMARFWANRFVQFLEFCGRTTQLTVRNFYQPKASSPDDRYALEALTPQTVTFGFANGTDSVLFTMNTNNIIVTADDSLPLADIYTQTLGITSQFDPNTAPTDTAVIADMSIAFTGS